MANTTLEITTPPAEQSTETTGRVGNTVAASWSVTLEDLRANLTHDNNSDEAIELFVWCYLYCTDSAHPIRREEFAEKVGYDHTTILKLLRGTYRHPETEVRQPIPAKLIKQMETFRALEIERGQKGRAQFSRTPTFMRIWGGCDLARESQTPVFIIGPSHVGKTVALEEYQKDHNHGHTVYVRLQAASGLGGMVKAIAGAIGGIGMKANTATLITSIKHKLTPNMVLILDEVHELMHTYRKEAFFACLEVIREIYDEAKCGLVLCGTKLLLGRIADNRGELEQLLRRGVHKIILPDQPTKADLTVILGDRGMKFPAQGDKVAVTVGGQTLTEEPYEMLRQVGLTEGLKAICERLRYAEKFAKKERVALEWKHVVRAHFTIRANEVPGDDWGTSAPAKKAA